MTRPALWIGSIFFKTKPATELAPLWQQRSGLRVQKQTSTSDIFNVQPASEQVRLTMDSELVVTQLVWLQPKRTAIRVNKNAGQSDGGACLHCFP